MWKYLILTLSLYACSSTKSIKDLTLPPVSHIAGNFIESLPDGFVFSDSSQKIKIAYPSGIESVPHLVSGQKLDIYGNLRPGIPKIFDAYVIKSESQEYILEQPGGIVMFHIQSPF